MTLLSARPAGRREWIGDRTPKPLKLSALPQIDAAGLTLHNALHVARQPLDFDWHGRAIRLRLLPEETAIDAAWAVSFALAEFELNEFEPRRSTLRLSGSAEAFDRLGQHPDRRRALDEVDRELAAMWLEIVWLDWLAPLEATLDTDIHLQPAESMPIASRAAPTMRLCFAVDLDGESHPLALDLPVATAERLLPLLDRGFPPRPAPANDVVASLRLESGKQSLTLGEWRSLRPGDVVMLDAATADGVQLNLADRFGCRARFIDGGLRADGPLVANHPDRTVNSSYEESVMSEPPVDKPMPSAHSATAVDKSNSTGPNASGPNNSGLNLDELPVQLTCELGRLEMSLGELRKLGDGSVLPLERQPDQAVDLLVNGKRMGRGRLVSIGDAIGVQVERLALDEGRTADD